MDFKEELAQMYAKPGHKKCLGRGYEIEANPKEPQVKKYCSCVMNNIRKLKKLEVH